jgi:DNA-directed RNA polymerase
MTTEINAALAAQYAREQAMADRGRERAQHQIDRAVQGERAAETPAGIALAKRAIEPLVKAVEEFLEASYSGKAGRRHSAAALIKDLPLDLAAFITVKLALSGAAREQRLKGLSLSIGQALMMELTAAEFEKREEALYRAVIRNAEARGMTTARIALAVQKANKTFNVVEKTWTEAECVVLGTKLVELMIESTGIINVFLKADGRNRKAPCVCLTPQIDKWAKEYNEASTLLRPVFMPSVVPPQPWAGTKGSPYYGLHSRFNGILTRGFPGQSKALDEADMRTTFTGLNAIQETPWRINRRVLEVMQQAWERDAGLECLPRRDDEAIPESPPEVVNDVVGGPHRKAWRKLVRPIYERINANRSKRFEFVRTMSIAQDYVEEEAIYFPHRLDFRGRCYAVTASLSPQGADHSKGLLEFSEGKPLGERGLFWLGVHGANLFGNDKVSLEERYQWAISSINKTRNVAADPLSDLWWTEADNPWCFLAWCFEWAEARDGSFVSHLPIALDGSCNGIQHFSAMLRDPVGGVAVNLVPADKPSDIYGTVAEKTVEKLRAEADPEVQWMAQSWVAFGINRKITKRAVMVLPYGGTFKSCMEYVREAVREAIKDGKEDPFGDDLPRAAAYLAKQVWASIGETVIAARDAMTWLQKCARVATKAGIDLRWTTPSGFVCFQNYKELEERRIKTRFQGTIIQFSSLNTTDELDKHKQASAVSPNFVHSLDASAMMLTIQSCLAKGVSSFAMIHDSYGTHAADTDTLGETLREEFVRMYQDHDVLAEFAEELRKRLPEELVEELPPLPEMGSLDLEAVKVSAYFFA